MNSFKLKSLQIKHTLTNLQIKFIAIIISENGIIRRYKIYRC